MKKFLNPLNIELVDICNLLFFLFVLPICIVVVILLGLGLIK
jgi:hypothetical protein